MTATFQPPKTPQDSPAERAERHIQTIVVEADWRDQKDCAVLLVACAGLRPSEALALRWEDLDLERGKATVRVKPYPAPHTVEIPVGACAALAALRRAQGQRLATYWKHLAVDEGGERLAAPGTPVVCTVKGDYVNPRKFARWWADRAASLGLHGVSLRDVRRDHAILAQSREAEAGR